jgi:hypothetical protein
MALITALTVLGRRAQERRGLFAGDGGEHERGFDERALVGYRGLIRDVDSHPGNAGGANSTSTLLVAYLAGGGDRARGPADSLVITPLDPHRRDLNDVSFFRVHRAVIRQ